MRRSCWVVVVCAAGCGRMGFDEVRLGVSDDASVLDDGPDGGAGDGGIDGVATACRSSSSYVPLGGLLHVYRMAGPATWANARLQCAGDDAYLVILDESTEAVLAPRGWVGFTDQVTEGVWLTSTGAVPTYLPWEGAQPDGGTLENCAAIELGANGRIEDQSCSDTKNFMCECD